MTRRKVLTSEPVSCLKGAHLRSPFSVERVHPDAPFPEQKVLTSAIKVLTSAIKVLTSEPLFGLPSGSLRVFVALTRAGGMQTLRFATGSHSNSHLDSLTRVVANRVDSRNHLTCRGAA